MDLQSQTPLDDVKTKLTGSELSVEMKVSSAAPVGIVYLGLEEDWVRRKNRLVD